MFPCVGVNLLVNGIAYLSVVKKLYRPSISGWLVNIGTGGVEVDFAGTEIDHLTTFPNVP